MVDRPPRPDGELDAAHPRRRDVDQRHRPGHRAARAPPRHRRWSSAPLEVLPLLRGAFCFVWMDEGTLYAARDPQGIRPLVLGRLERGWVVASEDAALDIVGACVVREVEPGELIVIDENGLRSHRFAEPAPKGCLFEFVYLARPDTTISRPATCTSVRVEIGRRLAREYPGRGRPGHPGPRVRHAAPRSATPRSPGIPYGQGFVKNSYVGRTFIQPSQTIRQLGIRLKLNALAHVIARQAARRGRRLDRARQHPARAGADAARGRGARGARPHLQPAGEVAVLLRHRLRHPRRADRQRADAPTRSAARIGADSLGYISLEGLVEATTVPTATTCAGLLRRRLPDRAARRERSSASTCSRRRCVADDGPRAAGPQQPLSRTRRHPRRHVTEQPDSADPRRAPTPPPVSPSRPPTEPSS